LKNTGLEVYWSVADELISFYCLLKPSYIGVLDSLASER